MPDTAHDATTPSSTGMSNCQGHDGEKATAEGERGARTRAAGGARGAAHARGGARRAAQGGVRGGAERTSCCRVNSRHMSAVLSVCVVPAASAAAPVTETTAGGRSLMLKPKRSCAASA